MCLQLVKGHEMESICLVYGVLSVYKWGKNQLGTYMLLYIEAVRTFSHSPQQNI